MEDLSSWQCPHVTMYILSGNSGVEASFEFLWIFLFMMNFSGDTSPVCEKPSKWVVGTYQWVVGCVGLCQTLNRIRDVAETSLQFD